MHTTAAQVCATPSPGTKRRPPALAVSGRVGADGGSEMWQVRWNLRGFVSWTRDDHGVGNFGSRAGTLSSTQLSAIRSPTNSAEMASAFPLGRPEITACDGSSLGKRGGFAGLGSSITLIAMLALTLKKSV